MLVLHLPNFLIHKGAMVSKMLSFLMGPFGR